MLLAGAVACGTVTGENEESGVRLALDETYDEVRSGIRLILAYDMPSNSFVGTMERAS